MDPVTLSLVFVSLFLLLYWHLTRDLGYWAAQGVAHEKGVPVLGSIADMLLCRAHECQVSERLYRGYPEEPFVGYFQMGNPALLVRDPALIKEVLLRDFGNGMDRGFRVDEARSPLTNNLFFLSGHRWRHLRAVLSPSFSGAHLKAMFPLMAHTASRLEERVLNTKDQPMDVSELTARYTIDNIAACAFGLNLNSLADEESQFFRTSVKVFGSGRLTHVIRLVQMFSMGVWKLLNFTFPDKQATRFYLDTVRDLVAFRLRNPQLAASTNDVLQHLIRLRGKEIAPARPDQKEAAFVMTDEVLAAQAFFFLVGGFETTASAIAFSLLELAQNPLVQRRLQQEVDQVMEATGGKLTYDVVNNSMPYLEMVMMETMRKWPVVVAVGRHVSSPCVIPGTHVRLKPGTGVLVPVFSIHRDPDFYPDPEVFDPERFSEENRTSRHQATYLPFGDGPHMCIGMRIAQLQFKLALATLASKFHVQPCEKTTWPVKILPTAFVLSVQGGIWLKVESRDKSAGRQITS